MVRHASDTKGKMDSRLLFLPAVIGFVLYLLAIGHGFVLDDNLVITQNEHVQEGFGGMDEILTTNYTHGHQGFNDGLYRPLSLLTFAIEQALFDLNPAVSHFIQALLYGLLLLVLALWLGRTLGEHSWSAFWVLLLFAVHPIHTEVVANLKSRDEILALLFFAVAAWLFTRYLDHRKVADLALALVAFLLSLFSKESAITFLAIFPLLHYFHAKDTTVSYVRTILFFAVPPAIFLIIRSSVLSSMGDVDSGVTGILQNILTTTDSWTERIATAVVVQGEYILQLFIPYPLSHDYSYHEIPLYDLSSPAFWVSLLVIAATIIVAVRSWRSRKMYGFGIFFYFVTISVVANVVILIGALKAERFLFTPSLGWSMAVVSAVSCTQMLRPRRAWIFAGLSLVFIVLTVQRIPDWESNYTLFAADVDKVPNSARAHYNYGTSSNTEAKQDPRNRQELRATAERHLRRAIEIWPDYQDAYNNLGVVYIDQGENEKALTVYQELYQRFPEYSKGLFNLAVTAYRLKRYAEAEEYLETYYGRVQRNDALYLIAESEGYQSKFNEAIGHLKELIELEPTRSRGPLKLGMAYGITGDESQAEYYFKMAVQREPNNAEAHLNLGLLYLNTQRQDLARSELSTALSLDPNLEQARQLLNQIK